jgi:hypothetical protein
MGGKNMKKILFMLTVLVTFIIASVLYGAHSLIIEEKKAITLEEAYTAQYSKTMPDIMFDPIPTNIPF